MASRSPPRSATRQSVMVEEGEVSGRSLIGGQVHRRQRLRRRYEAALPTATVGGAPNGTWRDFGRVCASRGALEWHRHQPNPEALMLARSSSLGLLAALAIWLPS